MATVSNVHCRILSMLSFVDQSVLSFVSLQLGRHYYAGRAAIYALPHISSF